MNKKITTVFGIMALLLMAVAPTAHAEKPVWGDMDLQFNLGWPGPQDTVPAWVGTIMIDGDEYGMAFFNLGTGKPFDEQPSHNVFFGERWTIYADLEFEFDENGVLATFVPGDTVLSGYDRGITTDRNSKYRMNGDVTVATGGFEQLLQRKVHMSGDIVWYDFGAPQFGPGTFRIN